MSASARPPPASAGPRVAHVTLSGRGRPGPSIGRVAAAIYAVVAVVYLVSTGPARLSTHTAYNHFALLAEAWLDGRLDLGGAPPDYTGWNDFAVFGERVHVSFPPFPALLIAPLVALRGSAEATPDAAFFALVAAIGPALLFVALERLAATGRARRTWQENVALALVAAFGTVLWSTAAQGTVWFAAHVTAFALTAGYLAASVEARHPALAGLLLGCAFATRTPLFLLAPFFLSELWLRARRTRESDRAGTLDWRPAALDLARFAAPLVLVLGVLAWHNHARFGDVAEFGHRHLAIAWRPRIERWGLFSLHYLGKNLGVMLASTPFLGAKGAPFAIGGHGLALWITSPVYAFALWPRHLAGRARISFMVLASLAGAIALVDLTYQNTGWVQFGYRFSNDFAPLLVLLMALGRRPLGGRFAVVAAVSIAVNAFGAASFQRPGWERWYAVEPTQRVVFEPD